MGDGTLTIADVTERLRISRTKLWELCRSGAIRHAKVGRSVRFKPEWIDDYLARCSPVHAHGESVGMSILNAGEHR